MNTSQNISLKRSFCLSAIFLIIGLFGGETAYSQKMLPVSSLGKDKPFRLAVESRDRPIHSKDSICLSWLEGQPVLLASKGETFCFQIALCALSDLDDVKISFSDFNSGTSRIDASKLTCYNRDGVDIYGKPFKKIISVKENHVQALWMGVDLSSASEGIYQGSMTAEAAGHSEKIDIIFSVNSNAVDNHGYNEGWRMSRLDWLNCTIAQDHEITKGYEPVTRDGNVLSILGRKLILGSDGFPASVESFFTGSNQTISSIGSPILAAPAGFVIETNKGREKLKGSKIKFDSPGKDCISWETALSSEHFRICTQARLEYDGFLRYDLTLEAKRDCPVRDIRLEIPFCKEKAEYIMGLGIEGGARKQDIDWKWDVKNNQDMLWVGGVNGGLRVKWMDENYIRPLVNVYYHYGELVEPISWCNDGKGGVRLTERSSDVLLNAYSGEREIKAGQILHFNFEMLLTPFRTISKDVMFCDRYFHGGDTNERSKVALADSLGANIINIHHASDLYPFINYPYLDENLQALKEIVDDAHAHGKRMKFYYTTRELTKNLPEFWAFYSLNGEIIFPGPGNTCRTITNPDGPGKWLLDNVRENYIPAWQAYVDRGIFKGETDLSVITTPDSRLNNFYIGGLDFMVRKMNLDGVYVDDSALERHTVRRARKIIDAHRPEGRMDLHSWNHLCDVAGNASCLNLYMELLPYFDLCWIGEGRDYDHPADNWLIEVSGIPFGLCGQMLQDGGNRWRGMLFGITNRAPWVGQGPEEIWKFWDKFGIKDMEMIGFWEKGTPVKTDCPDVLATLYKGRGRSIIAVASWADTDRSVRITADIPYSKIFQPEIIGYQSESNGINLDQAIVIPKGKGFLFVVE